MLWVSSFQRKIVINKPQELDLQLSYYVNVNVMMISGPCWLLEGCDRFLVGD